MNWAKGLSANYYVTIVDPVTWRDVDRVEITDGSIKRERDGLMQSAELTFINYGMDKEQWVRVYMDARQSGAMEHNALFTGLAISPDANYNGFRAENEVSCYSVLKPADDVYLTRGWYAASETDGAALVKNLLSIIPAPVEIVEDERKLITNAIVAEEKETHLTMAQKILAAINWELYITGQGEVLIRKPAEKPTLTLDPLNFDIIETEIKVSADWYDCPNVYMAVSDDLTGIARDDSPDSPLSTVNRGREVWMYEDGVTLGAQDTIAQYALRKLKEAQKVQKTASYDRRYVPQIMPGDILEMHYVSQGLNGNYKVESQDIELGYGARTSEEIAEVLV